MSEFIGSRISLISRSDIRYVGRLHDINSENHTVALEQVVSHGTEGRRGDPTKEIAGSDNVYEYIVFRGGDVKDLRIEETAPQPPQPQVPDDPAILGGRYGSSPYQQGAMYGAYPPPQGPQQPGLGQPPAGVPQAQQQPAQQHQQNQASQQQGQAQAPQQAPSVQQQTPTHGPQNRAPPQAPIGPAANRQQHTQQPMNRGPTHQVPSAQNSVAQSQLPAHAKINERQAPLASAQQTASDSSKPPTPPEDSETKSAPPAPVTQNASRAPTGPKAHGGIVPALPLPFHNRPPRSPAPSSSQPGTRNAQSTEASASTSTRNDTNAAVQDLANKVNQLAMKTAVPAGNNVAGPAPALNDTNGGPSGEPRPARGPGTGGFIARGASRGRSYRGGFQSNQLRKVEVPSTDYDFASANAKFNKQDLAKEVIAGGEDERVAHPETPANGTNGYVDGNNKDEVVIPPAKFYNPFSSFFDNISCENKERAEAKEGEKPRGGAVWRGEEQKKNLETFGQGSVDGGPNHYGRGWRGRGRGRGNYGRGRGGGYGGSYNRGAYRRQSQVQQQQQDGGAAAAGDGDN
ncbi:unnamed protein product [Tuber aestivum]|uniref:DFDF domain-containing protein n=1 Tax=Tuber aestivum TaxID=59557 RepID=A0A292PXB2_9PEZI|nr:unnamed protein product [Tuber aestivum]